MATVRRVVCGRTTRHLRHRDRRLVRCGVAIELSRSDAAEPCAQQRGQTEGRCRPPYHAVNSSMTRRSAEHPSELQSLMRILYTALCLEQHNYHIHIRTTKSTHQQMNTQQP